MEKKLYPLQFLPIVDEYDWGREIFRVADLGYKDSVVKEGWLMANPLSDVMDTYMERVVGDTVYDRFGRQFPVCVREFEVSGRMPLQVHPADDVASPRYDFLGKEKIWYIVSAEKDARLYVGFKDDVDASAVLSDSLLEKMNAVAPHEGQFIHIKPGVVHGASGHLRILEIGESSPMDFCMEQGVESEQFDPSLSVVEALDFIDYKKWKADDLLELDQFCVNAVKLTRPMQIGHNSSDSFVLYHVAKGEVSVQIPAGVNFIIKEAETVIVPSEVEEYTLVPLSGECSLLEVIVPPEKDPFSA